MIRHLFKLIWNKKKQNFLLITEMLVSFIVIFAVFTLLVYFYLNYRKPIGIQYDHVWAVKFGDQRSTKNMDSLTQYFESISNVLHSMPQIKKASLVSGNFPFSPNTDNTLVSFGKKSAMSNFYVTQEDYPAILHLNILEGRWFNKSDDASERKPVVINESLKEDLFGNGSAIGKILGEGSQQQEIVGVVNNVKDKGDFRAPQNGMFVRMDTSKYYMVETILLSVQPDADAAFESRLFKALSNAIGYSIEIVHLPTQRRIINSITFKPTIILFIIAGFLIINVALGLFGVLWYNINKRKSEIGLRRAVGASGISISKQLVGEALILSTFSLIIGTFFAIQFPLLNVFDLPAQVYLIAIALAILFIYLLVIACAFYPGKQAAGIYPAVALHED
jgi:putative ABC transport system permease protein